MRAQAMVRLHAESPQSHEGALRGVEGAPPLGETDDPHGEAADGQPVAVDLTVDEGTVKLWLEVCPSGFGARPWPRSGVG